MGYRSDVATAIAVRTNKLERLMALYMQHPLVQETHAAEAWEVYDYQYAEGYTLLLHRAEGVKWYPSYNDVQAIDYLYELLVNLNQDSADIPFAMRRIEIGEEEDDTRIENCESYTDNDHKLLEIVWETLGICRSIMVDI